MPTEEDVKNQLELLVNYRITLAISLRKLSFFGVNPPVDLVLTIKDSRRAIKRIKNILRDWNVQFEDHPDDEDEIYVFQSFERMKLLSKIDFLRIVLVVIFLMFAIWLVLRMMPMLASFYSPQYEQDKAINPSVVAGMSEAEVTASTAEPVDVGLSGMTVYDLESTITAGKISGRSVFDLEFAEMRLMNYVVSALPAGKNIKDFIAEATFYNPYSASEGMWSYGISFRRYSNHPEFRGHSFYINSQGGWVLRSEKNGSINIIDSGDLSNIDLLGGESNKLKVMVKGRTANLFVNDKFIASIEIEDEDSGDVAIAANYSGYEFIDGKTVRCREFQIWSLD